MRFAYLACALLLAGCGATLKASNERSAVVHAGGLQSAMALADATCAKHGRKAQFTQERPEFVFTFACVE